MDFQLSIIDGTTYTPESISEILKNKYLIKWKYDPKSSFYCGVAKDVNERLAQHKREDWGIADIIAVVNCGTRDKAANVEELMNKAGFDVGASDTPGNGSCPETTYVYLVKKGPIVNGTNTLNDFLNNVNKNRRI